MGANGILQINKTSGALLAQSCRFPNRYNFTDITLIGKIIPDLWIINENFVKVLENLLIHSITNPLAGQIWWDTVVRIKVYTGTAWTTGGGPIVNH